MKYSLSLASIAVLTVAFAGCSFTGSPSPYGDASSSSSEASVSSESFEELSYTGTVQKLGVSIYMEGTHRLDLGAGEYMLLESDIFTLDDFVGEEVRVTGLVRPTVEGDARIMRVTQIASLLTGGSSESSASSEEASSSSEEASSSVASSLPPPPPPVSSSSVRPVVSSSVPSVKASSASSVTGADGSRSSQAAAMAKAKMDATSWTQQYCSSHIGFCIALHKNWWFMSFGATETELWHVEAGTAEISAIGDGPIVISFLSGGIPSGMQDYAVVADGEDVVGYRSWTGQRHFEVRAPAALRAAVEYMVQNLTTYEEPVQQ